MSPCGSSRRRFRGIIARIRVSDDSATIEDLGSKNGTYLRGERLAEPSALQDGDEIRLRLRSRSRSVSVKTLGSTVTQTSR